MNAVLNIRDGIVAVFDGAMNVIGFTVLGVHKSLKFLLGLALMSLAISTFLKFLGSMWLIVASGGSVLLERDPLDVLGPLIVVAGVMALVIWRRWRDGPDPPHHEDLRKRTDSTG